jgi:hypothetical protein
MSAKDLCQMTIIHPYHSASDALTDIPVSSEKSRGPAIQGVLVHGAFDDGPSRQYSKAAAEDAAEVELAIGQDMLRTLPDGVVVLLRPALLQAYNVRRWIIAREDGADVGQALSTKGREIFQAPAIQSDDSQLWCHSGAAGSDVKALVIVGTVAVELMGSSRDVRSSIDADVLQVPTWPGTHHHSPTHMHPPLRVGSRLLFF